MFAFLDLQVTAFISLLDIFRNFSVLFSFWSWEWLFFEGGGSMQSSANHNILVSSFSIFIYFMSYYMGV